jgi:hypothetical protein
MDYHISTSTIRDLPLSALWLVFCYLSGLWPGRLLVSPEVLIPLMAYTTTRTGLRVEPVVDIAAAPMDQQVSAEALGHRHMDPPLFTAMMRTMCSTRPQQPTTHGIRMYTSLGKVCALLCID